MDARDAAASPRRDAAAASPRRDAAAASPEDAGAIVERLSEEFLDAFDAMVTTARTLRRVRPLPCNLSTCTFTGQLAFPGVDAATAATVFGRITSAYKMELELLRDLDEDSTFALDRDADDDDGDDDDARPRRKTFAHQITLHAGSRSIKLFKNGTLHGTGCPSPVEFLDLASRFIEFVQRVCGDRIPPDLGLASIETRMVNAMFVVTDADTGRILKIRPDALTAVADRAEHETERHPGVKVQLFMDGPTRVDPPKGKRVTVRFFQTGTVTVTGAREPSHLAVAHDYACRVLDDNYDAVCRVDTKTPFRTTTAPRVLNLIGGYPANQYNACFTAAR
jgi:hypothetical protein